MGLAILGTLIFLFLLGIVITAVILGIINSISGNLNDSNYKSKSGDCAKVKDKIEGVLDTIATFRLINGLLLGLFILLFIIMIVATVLYVKSGKYKNSEGGNFLTNIILSRTFFIIIMVILLIIFLTYTIVYGTMFSTLNSIDKNCFSGDESTEDTEKYFFAKALSQSRIQFFTCLFMLIIVVIALGIGIFIIFKARNKTDEIKKRAGDIILGASEGLKSLKEKFGGVGGQEEGLA